LGASFDPAVSADLVRRGGQVEESQEGKDDIAETWSTEQGRLYREKTPGHSTASRLLVEGSLEWLPSMGRWKANDFGGQFWAFLVCYDF
jgi:hypothetical protein